MEVQSPFPPGPLFEQQEELEKALHVTGSDGDDDGNGDAASPEDDRLTWLRRRVCAGLDIPDTLFTSFLLENQSFLLDFFESPSAPWLILYTALSSTHQTPRLSLSSQNVVRKAAAAVVTFASDSIELHAYTGSNPRDLGRTTEHMMYFMKLKSSGLTTCEDLDVSLEYGVLPAGPSLDSLEQVLHINNYGMWTKEKKRFSPQDK